MKKKKLAAKQVKLIINIISLLIFLVSYFYVFNGLENKTVAANKKIDTINSDMIVHKQKLKEEVTISKKMEKIKKEKAGIIDSFPVQIAKEDNFIFVTNLEDALHIHFSSIDMTDSVPVYQTILPARSNTKDAKASTATDTASSGSTQTGNTDTSNNMQTGNTAASNNTQTGNTTVSDNTQTANNTASGNKTTSSADNSTVSQGDSSGNAVSQGKKASQGNMIGMQTTINLTFKTTYKNFKKLVNYIKDCPDKAMIETAAVSYDNTTGGLTGNIVVKRFALTGTGKVYESPYIKDINIGTDNIFGTDRNK